MTRVVTLGDSITMGMGDPAPGGGWRGWAHYLAGGLARPELHNLAVRCAQAKHVERDQLPAAIELRPDIPSVLVGINDTLRAGFDPVRTGQATARTVAALTASGATVLTMRLPDPAQMFGLPTALARPLTRRLPAAAGCEVSARPDAEPSGPGATRRDDFVWMATKGTSWCLRRSIDLIPY